MYHEDVWKIGVGQCGSCGMRIWSVVKDGNQISCPNCGCVHEVEVDEMEDLSSGETKQIALLVPVNRKGERPRQLNEN